MSRRTPSRARPRPSAPSAPRGPRRPRTAVARDAAVVAAVVVGAGAALAFDAAADSGPLDVRPAASTDVVPVAFPAGLDLDRPASSLAVEHRDPGAMAAERGQAATDAAAQLAAEREAARVAEEQAAAAARAAEREAMWDRLADCESGAWDRTGDPIPGTATWDYGLRPGQDGFFQGGLQFHPVTWDEFRDAGMSDHAGNATRSQQIAIAERVLDAQGWGAWPVCSKKLGYR